ncbi:MAG: adenylate/guanylate cyclase domain-containing protein [Candidatus Sedimenticola sp. (ex Thyasira tokunagai)]
MISKIERHNIARLVGIFALLLLFLLSFLDPLFVQTVRLKTNDLFLKQHLSEQVETPIIIVDIDDRSLGELGQWPWPRIRLAEMIAHISKGGPKAIGLDIVFAEADGSSPRQVAAVLGPARLTERCLADLITLPDHDQLFQEALAGVPVILGFPFGFDGSDVPGKLSCSPSQAAVIGTPPGEWLFSATSAVENLQLLQKAAAGSGFFNVLPDVDGVVRRLPLILSHGDQLYNSLVLEMIRVGEGGAMIQVRATDNGMESVRVAEHAIPTDANGQMLVRYNSPERPFRRVSAVDVVTAGVDPVIFRGAYVLIGISAKGIQDFVATPVSGHYPGVGVHANAVNTILSDEFLQQPDWAKGGELIYLVLMSSVLIALIPAIGAVKSGLLFIITTTLVSYFSYWLFNRYGLFFDPVYPLLFSILIFFVLTFVNYILEEGERRNTRNAFSKFLSPVLVNELLKSPEGLTLSGEEREVTALFSDIRRFTSISEDLQPQEVCTFLNQYFSVMAQILMDHRATVDKFIGDAVYAFWNAPLSDEYHTRNAMVAALKMREGLEKLNGQWKVGTLPQVKAGIGIHTGLAQVGNIGSENHLSYTAIGDTVNLTSRLESISKVYDVVIIVSDEAMHACRDDRFAFRKLDLIKVVGREQPVLIHELLGEKSLLSQTRLDELAGYHSALDHYFAAEFSAALALFRQLSDKRYTKLHQLFIDRCLHYIDHPPVEGWDGISRYTSK